MTTQWDPPQIDTTSEVAASPRRPRRRRAAVLGVAAGLLGGGAIGLMATAPGLSSAQVGPQTPARTASLTAPNVAPDVGDPVDAEPLDDAARTQEHVARIREALQSLIDDGTITAEQADAVAAALAAQRIEHGGPGGRLGGPGGDGRLGGPGGDGRRGDGAIAIERQALSELLGLDADEIRTAIESGSTIAEIAQANGVEVATVIDGLVAAAQERIDAAVADGKLTAEEAAERTTQMTERITEMVNTPLPAGPPHRVPGDRPGPVDVPGADTATTDVAPDA